ncbi:MAG: tail fiber domain-containing protein, partial [Brevinematales bacterium]
TTPEFGWGDIHTLTPVLTQTLTGGGRVGIGTTTPSYQLQLTQDSAAKPSTSTWTISSDERLKTNLSLADLDRCYEIVKTLPLKRFTWKDDVYSPDEVQDRSKIGWLASDVQAVFPKAIYTYQLKKEAPVLDEEGKPIYETYYETVTTEGGEESVVEKTRLKTQEIVIEDCLS